MMSMNDSWEDRAKKAEVELEEWKSTFRKFQSDLWLISPAPEQMKIISNLMEPMNKLLKVSQET